MDKLSLQTKIQLFLIAALALFALSLILSQKANPSIPPLFSLKRIQEKVYLKLKSNPQERLDYMLYLLNNRLEELDGVVKGKKYQYVLPAASRYSTLAGEIAQLITTNNLTDMVTPIKNQFEEHKKRLNELYVLYPKNTDNVEYKYIEDDINYLNIYLDQLSKVK